MNNRIHSVTQLTRRAAPILRVFAAGQGVVQLFNLVGGFLVLRWLSIGDYGKYGLAYSFQSTVNVLVDLGFSTTIVALVAHRTDDSKVIGNYVCSGRSIRLKIFCAVVPAAIVVFLYQTRIQQWSLPLQVSILLTILLSTYSSGISGYYGAPFFMTRRLGPYYRIQLVGSSIRLFGLPCLYALHLLDVGTALWVNAAATLITALSLQSSAKRLIEEPVRPDPAITKQMVSYFLPNLPSVIFFAFQGQIAVFLIALFSDSAAIARVSALARLGQIFVFLTALNPAVFEPWFARAYGAQVYRRVALAVGTSLSISALLLLTAAIAPGVFLILLGSNYMDLGTELLWSLAGSCVWYLIGVMWTAVSARRLIFWETTWLNIALVLFSQIFFIARFGVSTPLRAVQLNLAMALASLTAYVSTFIYGAIRGPRVALSLEPAA